MRFERRVANLGSSSALIIPPELLKYLGVKNGDSMVIEDYIRKDGKKYCSIWKKGE